MSHRCRISGCCEPALPGSLPPRCKKHSDDRKRKQAASHEYNRLIALPMEASCPACGLPMEHLPFNCEKHAQYWNYHNRREREEQESGRARRFELAQKFEEMLRAHREFYPQSYEKEPK